VRFGAFPSGYESDDRRAPFERALLQRVRELPTVESAGVLSSFPLERGGNMPVVVEGRPDAAEGAVQLRAVTPGALEALRVPLLRGRAFRETDDATTSPAALVSESYARLHFPNEDPIGRRLEIGRWKDFWIMSYHGGTEIIGVVGDVRDLSLSEGAHRTVYIPLQAGASARPQLVVHTSQPEAVRLQLEQIVATLDPQVTPPQVVPLATIVGASLTRQRFQMVILSIFAGSALLLTAIGIFGLLSYTVHQRMREIGVRIALGARPGVVFRDIVGRGMKLVIVGGGVGVAAALVLTRFLAAMLYGVTATDAGVFIAGVAVLAASAFVACVLPARRAANIDPLVALRTE
jgi:predicted permease